MGLLKCSLGNVSVSPLVASSVRRGVSPVLVSHVSTVRYDSSIVNNCECRVAIAGWWPTL